MIRALAVRINSQSIICGENIRKMIASILHFLKGMAIYQDVRIIPSSQGNFISRVANSCYKNELYKRGDLSRLQLVKNNSRIKILECQRFSKFSLENGGILQDSQSPKSWARTPCRYVPNRRCKSLVCHTHQEDDGYVGQVSIALRRNWRRNFGKHFLLCDIAWVASVFQKK